MVSDSSSLTYSKLFDESSFNSFSCCSVFNDHAASATEVHLNKFLLWSQLPIFSSVFLWLTLRYFPRFQPSASRRLIIISLVCACVNMLFLANFQITMLISTLFSLTSTSATISKLKIPFKHVKFAVIKNRTTLLTFSNKYVSYLKDNHFFKKYSSVSQSSYFMVTVNGYC